MMLGKHLAQLRQATMDSGLDGANRLIEQARQLWIAQPLDVAQHNHLTIGER